MAEIYLTYEEILQLEQALIELDEQNTTNTLEIHKRDAKTIFLIKQVEEIEEVLASKENGATSKELRELREQQSTLNKQIH
jgi:dsDNA-binding SOS-regulon protein